MYQLIRTLPNGVERSQSPVKRVRDAAVLASYVLYDNREASKADAQRFAAQLGRAPLGENLTHEPSGYAFRIVKEVADVR